MAQTSYQGEEIRVEAQGTKGQWHRSHIDSAAINAALPLFLDVDDEQCSYSDIVGVSPEYS
ncbi:MAG TPA: hypothetical protein VKR83_20730 [Ktedonobacteraceae bacterium]|nr:hypothetical protein [Ktedonobacteraceae bacterium]